MLHRAPRRAPLAILAAAAAALVPARAPAKIGLQGTFTGDVGWTDNVMNAPRNALQLGLLPPAADAMFELRPGLILSAGSARAVQQATAVFQADLFALHPEGNSYSGALSWSGFFLPSRTTELLVQAEASDGRLNTFNLNLPSSGATVGVLPALATSTTFFQASLSESLVWSLPQNWRLSESLTGRSWLDLDPRQLPDTHEALGELSADHIWKVDSLGFDLKLDYVYYSEVRDPTTNAVTLNTQQQLINTLLARWRRDWTHFWSTELDLGAIEANNIGPVYQSGSNVPIDGGVVIWQPAALAALRYYHQLASGELMYQHGILPNAIAGSTFAIDEVSLRVTVPFPVRTHLFFGATGAYQHARSIDFATGFTISTAEVVLVDATLDWQPRPEIGVFARYSLFDQIGHPEEGPLAQLDIKRNIVLIGLNFVYPAVPAARVPSRQATRVDRSDQPAIPEPHSPTLPQ